jgi:hypothetical protein
MTTGVGRRDLYFETIANLKFISKIKVGEKVDVQSQQLCIDNWVTSMYRTFVARKESRDYTFNYFRTTVNNAIDLISALVQEESEANRKKITSIVESLDESRVGFLNLKKTYGDDRMFESKIETLISTIDVRVREIVGRDEI